MTWGHTKDWRGTADERFLNAVCIVASGCWEWQKGIFGKNGYGALDVDGRTIGAHRFSYERYVGPIPKGKHIDHLCRNRKCVKPSHLELVEPGENVLRGIGISARNAKKTHCKRGHEFTVENTYVRPHKGGRACKICKANQYLQSKA